MPTRKAAAPHSDDLDPLSPSSAQIGGLVMKAASVIASPGTDVRHVVPRVPRRLPGALGRFR